MLANRISDTARWFCDILSQRGGARCGDGACDLSRCRPIYCAATSWVGAYLLFFRFGAIPSQSSAIDRLERLCVFSNDPVVNGSRAHPRHTKSKLALIESAGAVGSDSGSAPKFTLTSDECLVTQGASKAKSAALGAVPPPRPN